MSAKTKGWIKNEVTGEKRSFMYNPQGFEHGRSATYAEISSPGSNYPVIRFVRGNSTVFGTELFLYDRPYTGAIDSFISFISEFLPPENYISTFEEPPELLFCMGPFIKRCVIESYSVAEDMYDDALNKTQARIMLQLRQVGA